MPEITNRTVIEGENINMSEEDEETVHTSRSRSNQGTDISIHDYFEKICFERSQRVSLRLKSIEDMLKLRFEMQDKAAALANKNLETRLDRLNELRNEVTQDRSRFITDEKYNVQHKVLEDKLELQEKALDTRITKLEMWQNKMYGVALGIGLVGGISGGFITKIFN